MSVLVILISSFGLFFYFLVAKQFGLIQVALNESYMFLYNVFKCDGSNSLVNILTLFVWPLILNLSISLSLRYFILSIRNSKMGTLDWILFIMLVLALVSFVPNSVFFKNRYVWGSY